MKAPGDESVRFETFSGPLAFMADVHGNLAALDAVIAACKASQASAYFVAGDLLYGGSEPLEVWKRLMEVGARCTRGTSDIALAAVDPDKLRPIDARQREAAERFRWTRSALGELIVARIRRLPDILRIELRDGSEIAVVHGSPEDPTEVITHDMSDDEASALLGTDPADMVVCGGSHVQFERTAGAVRVVGVGSVGDGTEAGTAQFALVEPSPDGLRVDLRWVRY